MLNQRAIKILNKYKNKAKLDESNVPIKTMKSAITVDEDIKHLFKVDKKFLNKYGNHIQAISSFDKNHLIKHGVKSSHIIKENVKTLSIKNLIEKYQLKNVDLFFVDAEGYDGKIIYDLLVKSNLRPIVIFEYIHIENNFLKKLIDLFKNKNFLYFNVGECLIVFPEEEKIEILF